MHTHTLELANQPINQSTYSAIFYLQKHGNDALLNSSFFKSHLLLLVNNSLTWFLFNCSLSLSLSFLSTSQNTDSVISFSPQNTTTATLNFAASLDADLHNIYFLLIWTTTTTTLSTHFQITQTHTPSFPFFTTKSDRITTSYLLLLQLLLLLWLKDIFKCCSSNQQIQQRLNTHTHNSHKSVVVFLVVVVVFRSWAVSGPALFLLSSSSSSPLFLLYTHYYYALFYIIYK